MKETHMERQTVIVLDFGGQYNQLIARRVREHNVYCELLPCTTPTDKILEKKPIGIIFTGGPSNIFEEGAPTVDKRLIESGVPILGICYGCQLIAQLCGGLVAKGPSEFGKQMIDIRPSRFFEGIKTPSSVWMSHGNYVEKLPEGFSVTATTPTCPVAAMECASKNLYGVQFHPEVKHTESGQKMLHNFLYTICGARGDWTMGNFADDTVARLKEKIGDKKVLCALSGGVDSAVAAALIHKACPSLVCVYVDHGLMRKNETEEIVRVFRDGQKMNLITVKAGERFLARLKGVTDPETKRKIIGEQFIREFETVSRGIGAVDYLVQGTIYPDVIESGLGKSAVIKSHHNVGGLPSVVDFKEIIEPLRDLFKDEVRACGFAIGLPASIVMRQPFPGPGLGIRIIGDITEEKVKILQEADWIYREEIAKAGLDKEIWQYFAILTNIRTVGVMGDERTYDYAVGLRAVTSVDGMTADWARIPYDVLEKISTRIVNEVKHVNRITYDVTSKPPATIEWE